MSSAAFDLSGPGFRRSPHATLREMQDLAPVYREPHLDAYCLTRYDDVVALGRDPRFSARRARRDRDRSPADLWPAIAEIESFLARTPPAADPPEHGPLRHAMAQAFAASGGPTLEEQAREAMDRWLGEVARGEVVDVLGDLALPLALRTLSRLLGVADRHVPRLSLWVRAIRAYAEARQATPDNTAAARAAIRQMCAFLRACPRQRDEEGGAAGLPSFCLLDLRDELDIQTLAALATVLVTGGLAPPVFQAGNAVLALLRDPDAMHRIRDGGEELLDTAVEECLRLEGAVLHVGRHTTAPVELHQTLIPAGAVVLGWLAAANLDPTRFSEPDRFVPDRTPNRHVGFGFGAHTCLGARLARAQLRALLAALLPRRPSLACSWEELVYVPSFAFRGLRELPVQLGD